MSDDVEDEIVALLSRELGLVSVRTVAAHLRTCEEYAEALIDLAVALGLLAASRGERRSSSTVARQRRSAREPTGRRSRR